ncbi:hypothetical protein MKX03_001124 [Papaver bracteatum]|nr:hypothetical protein MKX03_001124 [Papaver bracteatum]
MEAAHQEAGCGGGDVKICRRRNDGKTVNCMNVSGDNKIQYCDFHYKDFTDFYTENPSLITANKSKCLPKKKMEEIELVKKNKLPLPDEHLCRHNNGSWRCKNLRMGHGAAEDDHSVLKAKVCEKHYYYYRKNKKRSRDGDDGAAGTGPIETRDFNCSLGIQLATTDIEGGSANVGTKRKNVERTEWSGELDFADFFIEKPSLITSNEMKNNKEMEKKLPPDEQYCCLTNGMGWKCKKIRMSYGAAADDASVPNTKFCEKHYNYYSSYNKNYYKKKKTSGDGEGTGAGCTTATGPVEETNCSKLTEEDDDEEIQKLGATGHNTSDRIGRKGENVERAEKPGEPESLTGIREPTVELENLEHYKSKCFQLSVELEKRKLECTTLQGKLAEAEETRKTAAATTDGTERTPVDATECWKKMFSDLAESMESRILDLEKIVLRMDNKISTMEGCVESRISKLASLILRSGKESSILRCVQLRHSEKIESEAQGSQNDVTQSGEKQRDEKDRKDSHVYECKTKEKVLNVYDAGSLRLSSEGENVEERKGWGCSEERPSQHGSSSRDHQELSTEPFVNLVSDDDSVEILGESEDSDSSSDSEHSLGALMDMLAMKYSNTKEDKEIKWKFEADMISSFEKEPELCMKAVCALYRQQISEGKGLLHYSDALRCTTLAKFLMDGDCEGDLNKSVKELEIFDYEGVDDCKRLARRYSTQLFCIYQRRKDPFFLPSTTASHGDETAK